LPSWGHAGCDELPDIGLAIEHELAEQVILAGCRVDFGNALDVVDNVASDLGRPSHFAFDQDEQAVSNALLELSDLCRRRGLIIHLSTPTNTWRKKSLVSSRQYGKVFGGGAA
jgi:hypothetical protein